MPVNIFCLYFDSQGRAYNLFITIVKGLYAAGWLRRQAKLLAVAAVIGCSEVRGKAALCVSVLFMVLAGAISTAGI